MYKKIVLVEIEKIIKLQNQLSKISERIYFIKKASIIISMVIALINLYILFYYFEIFILAAKASCGFFILYIIGITLYINQLKSDSHKIKLLIYQEQKL